ncbi:hypothetical protein [Acinetobacter soli]|uniref:hypothetical protein n=1 Tax=Acinetobacter soli TaxID=487316 RepID=UPI00124D3ABC|nr:hypothetical protein [Acinetobacter soli]MDQ8943625.1 hypothetical protein [Acinetobacter soli]
MKKITLMFMVVWGLSGCGGSRDDHASNNTQTQSDPVLRETLTLTNQSQSSFSQSEPKSLKDISEASIDNKAEPLAVKF